jgi:hypothetical protein
VLNRFHELTEQAGLPVNASGLRRRRSALVRAG